jgi:hypothetical protein
VRHDKSEDQGEVGIYFGHYEYPCNGAEVHTFLSLSFNDKIDAAEKVKLLPPINLPLRVPKGNQVHFISRLYGRRKDELLADERLYIVSPEMFRPAGFQGGSFRTLVVQVTPEKMEAHWENHEPVGTIPTGTLPARADKALDKALLGKDVRKPDSPTWRELYATFPQGGALGLYVRKSSASFRSVTVEPFPK